MRPKARTRANQKIVVVAVSPQRGERLQGVEVEPDGRPPGRSQALEELRAVGGAGVLREHSQDRVIQARLPPARPEQRE